MNYYERHLGDYARDAGHLTMLEHGAYTLLLDRYYTTEQGIPEDQAHRICRARTRDEKAAVDAVLAEFFTLTDGLWTNGRAEREVTKMQAKVKAAQENGRRGGRPKGTKQEPSGLSVGSVSETQTKALQSPDTRHQEDPPASRVPPADAGKQKPRGSKRCPADFAIDADMRQFVRDALGGRVDADAELGRFKDHTFGTARSDWPATFRNWLREADARARQRPQSVHDRKAAEAAKWFRGTTLDPSTQQDYIDAVPLAIR